ncbi:MAG TPA: ABC transporter permease, partial [Ktedonobacteraceae bacterium]
MKISMYFNYTSRSLLRGGQRTILAIFCVAVGVMAIVALQLVGVMMQNSITSNVRDLNGGDISATAQNKPFTTSDLAFFDQLKSNGTISNYTAISAANGGLSAATPSFQDFHMNAVDPASYPLVSAPTFVAPNNGQVSNLLTNNQVIATQNFLDRYSKKLGDSFDVYIKSATGSGRILNVTIAGVIANSGGFAQAGNLLLVSNQDYQAAAPASSATYSSVAM